MRYFPKKIQFCNDFFYKPSTEILIIGFELKIRGAFSMFFLRKLHLSFFVERQYFVFKCQYFHISHKERIRKLVTGLNYTQY